MIKIKSSVQSQMYGQLEYNVHMATRRHIARHVEAVWARMPAIGACEEGIARVLEQELL